jgi:hypothetical protein
MPDTMMSVVKAYRLLKCKYVALLNELHSSDMNFPAQLMLELCVIRKRIIVFVPLNVPVL